jgi:hypothetical protein
MLALACRARNSSSQGLRSDTRAGRAPSARARRGGLDRTRTVVGSVRSPRARKHPSRRHGPCRSGTDRTAGPEVVLASVRSSIGSARNALPLRAGGGGPPRFKGVALRGGSGSDGRSASRDRPQKPHEEHASATHFPLSLRASGCRVGAGRAGGEGWGSPSITKCGDRFRGSRSSSSGRRLRAGSRRGRPTNRYRSPEPVRRRSAPERRDRETWYAARVGPFVRVDHGARRSRPGVENQAGRVGADERLPC